MTESEAKIKWCPYGYIDDGGRTPHNRDHDDQPVTHCIGSVCMAWRWKSHSTYTDPVSGITSVKMDRVPTYGYCGLAGAP
jgi:hypothetical protein